MSTVTCSSVQVSSITICNEMGTLLNGEHRAWFYASRCKSRFICCNAIASLLKMMLTDPLALGHEGR